MGIAHKMQLRFIQTCIKGMSKSQLFGVLGIIEKYPDTDPDKIKIMESLQDEFKKRNIDYKKEED